jgi:hypothetical protein
MLRLFLLLFLCTVFAACSSDDSTALSEWFNDHGVASSYVLRYEEIDLQVKNSSPGYNNSAYLVNSELTDYAALGNVNGVEQMLYFGLKVSAALSPVWKLRTDSIFYNNFYKGKIPEEQKITKAEFCWQEENETQPDTTWLKFSNEPATCKSISFKWEAGTLQDIFSVSLPDEFLNLRRNAAADTLRLLTSIKLLDNVVLRIVPPSVADIPGLLRVAQKSEIISRKCEQCLYAGIGDSLFVVFDIKPEDKIKIVGKPVVFAELVLPKSSGYMENGLEEIPIPVYIYSNGNPEDYRVNTAYVNDYECHPNVIFCKDYPLKLQVTQSMRNYANAANLQDSLEFTLRLGTPMLKPKSPYFYNLRNDKVFSDRFVFASYDFNSLAYGKQVTLKLWFADFGDKK